MTELEAAAGAPDLPGPATSARASRARVLRGVFLRSLVALAVVVAAVRVVPRPLATRRLPDGTVLTLERVTYGMAHEWYAGPPLIRRLGPVLPGPVLTALGGSWWIHGTRRPNTLVFWLEYRGRPTGLNSEWRATAFDEHGCEAETYETVTAGISEGGQPEMRWVDVGIFPRRGRTVGLRLYAISSDQQRSRIAEFVTENPAPGPYPSWTPQPLPAVVRDGDVEFRLTSGTYGFGLKVPPGVRRLDLTFALHRSRFVEFLAAPTRPAAPSGASR